MKISTKYNFGDFVYLKHDPEQHKRMIVMVVVSPNGLSYVVRCGDFEDVEVYDEEISLEKDVI